MFLDCGSEPAMTGVEAMVEAIRFYRLVIWLAILAKEGAAASEPERPFSAKITMTYLGFSAGKKPPNHA